MRIRPGFLALAGIAMGVVPAVAQTTPNAVDLDAVRIASERFKDVKVAVAEGYMRDPMNACVVGTELGLPADVGAMGVHYIHPGLLGITGPPDPRVSGTGVHTDFMKPAILLYEPQGDGSLELVGVENLVFESAWSAAGHSRPPHFGDHPFDHMVDDPGTELDEAHMFEPHYDLHVWAFRDNPNGVFTPFNPAVSCEHHGMAGHGN